METIAGAGMLGFFLAGIILFVLAILMPWYVYKSAVQLNGILKEVREINSTIKADAMRFRNAPLE